MKIQVTLFKARTQLGPMLFCPVDNQVENLNDVQEQGHTGHDQHEEDEDGLLCRPGHEALYSVGTWVSCAFNFGHHHETIQVVLPGYETGLQQDLHDHAGHVTGQQAALNVHFPLVVGVFGPFASWTLGLVLELLPQLFLLVDDVQDMSEIHERWRGHEDDLEGPEADVGYWESVVVADVCAAGLFGVADHFRLFISPHLFCTCSENHDPEDEQDRHPHLPDDRGVGLHLVQQLGEETPFPHVCVCKDLSGGRKWKVKSRSTQRSFTVLYRIKHLGNQKKFESIIEVLMFKTR